MNFITSLWDKMTGSGEGGNAEAEFSADPALDAESMKVYSQIKALGDRLGPGSALTSMGMQNYISRLKREGRGR